MAERTHGGPGRVRCPGLGVLVLALFLTCSGEARAQRCDGVTNWRRTTSRAQDEAYLRIIESLTSGHRVAPTRRCYLATQVMGQVRGQWAVAGRDLGREPTASSFTAWWNRVRGPTVHRDLTRARVFETEDDWGARQSWQLDRWGRSTGGYDLASAGAWGAYPGRGFGTSGNSLLRSFQTIQVLMARQAEEQRQKQQREQEERAHYAGKVLVHTARGPVLMDASQMNGLTVGAFGQDSGGGVDI